MPDQSTANSKWNDLSIFIWFCLSIVLRDFGWMSLWWISLLNGIYNVPLWKSCEPQALSSKTGQLWVISTAEWHWRCQSRIIKNRSDAESCGEMSAANGAVVSNCATHPSFVRVRQLPARRRYYHRWFQSRFAPLRRNFFCQSQPQRLRVSTTVDINYPLKSWLDCVFQTPTQPGSPAYISAEPLEFQKQHQCCCPPAKLSVVFMCLPHTDHSYYCSWAEWYRLVCSRCKHAALREFLSLLPDGNAAPSLGFGEKKWKFQVGARCE